MTEHLTAFIPADKASQTRLQSKQLPAPLAGDLTAPFVSGMSSHTHLEIVGAHLCLLIGKHNFRVFLRQEAVSLPLLRQGLWGRRHSLPWC